MRALDLALHKQDVDAVIAWLADDIIVRWPIAQWIKFVGIDQAHDLFRRVFGIISDIRSAATI